MPILQPFSNSIELTPISKQFGPTLSWIQRWNGGILAFPLKKICMYMCVSYCSYFSTDMIRLSYDLRYYLYAFHAIFNVIFLTFFAGSFQENTCYSTCTSTHWQTCSRWVSLSFLNHFFFSLYTYIHACRPTQHLVHTYCFVIYEIIYEILLTGVKYCKMCNQLSLERLTEWTNELADV